MNITQHELIGIAESLGELALGIAAYSFLPAPLSTIAIAVLLQMIKLVQEIHDRQT